LEENLTVVWDQIGQSLSDGPALFVGIPDSRYHSVMTVASEDDWESFVKVAKTSGVRILYARHDTLTNEMLAAMGTGLRERLEARLGETVGIRLAFVVDGVFHTWAEEAEWFVEEAARALDGSEEVVASQPEYEESWARELAELPEYGGSDRAWSVTMNFLAGKGVDVDADDLLVSRLYHEAADIFENEIKTRLENEAIGQLAVLYVEVAREHTGWSSSGTKVRDQLATRFIRARYGFSMPVVASALARYKPPVETAP